MLISNLNIIVQLTELFNVIELFDFLKINIISYPHVFESLQKETFLKLSLSEKLHEVLLLEIICQKCNN